MSASTKAASPPADAARRPASAVSSAVTSSGVRRAAASRAACTLQVGDRSGDYEGTGNGPLSAFTDALAGAGLTVDILDFHEHATTTGPDSEAVAYAQCRVDGVTRWGAGRDTSVLAASVQAVLSAVNGAGAQ
jgi:2-isopropylmalate synthase